MKSKVKPASSKALKIWEQTIRRMSLETLMGMLEEATLPDFPTGREAEIQLLNKELNRRQEPNDN